MGLTVSDIAAVIEEITPALTGGWIQKIHQPAPETITLEIRTPGQTLSLLMSAHPETARFHLASQLLPNPPAPPAFCQFLRAHVQGARVDSVPQVAGDRIVRLHLTAREGRHTLVAELTGRHADLLLLNEREKVLATIHDNRDRVGRLYQPPTQRPHVSRETVQGAWPSPGDDRPFPVSALLEERCRQREADASTERVRQVRLTGLRKAIKKAARRIEALREDLDKANRFQGYARYGELLKASLGMIKKGQERITVVDYFDPAQPELVIPLDPSKSPQGNMDDYFKKHRKYLAAGKEITPRIEDIERELAALRKEQQAIQEGSWLPPESDSAPARKGRPRSRAQSSALSSQHSTRSGPFRRFVSADGLPIYVGRNAKENEELTLKFAHSDDLWLHAQGVPGSHVVVRLEKGANPPPETMKDAATLALLYSDFKKSGKGDVIYTRRKYVKKAKGRPPGTVMVTQEKAIYLQLDRARLDRLKESR
ncbi:MAG TPA: NFACT family protein [Nitrospiraceae bacterium]|jgi:predicted ribosome quality control (RQC) complex YloA/Tae2 family protein